MAQGGENPREGNDGRRITTYEIELGVSCYSFRNADEHHRLCAHSKEQNQTRRIASWARICILRSQVGQVFAMGRLRRG